MYTRFYLSGDKPYMCAQYKGFCILQFIYLGIYLLLCTFYIALCLASIHLMLLFFIRYSVLFALVLFCVTESHAAAAL